MAHTPGPYRVLVPKQYGEGQEFDRLIVTLDGRHVAEVFQYQDHYHILEREEAEANASLFARAPALEAACIDTVNLLNDILLAPDEQVSETVKFVLRSIRDRAYAAVRGE